MLALDCTDSDDEAPLESDAVSAAATPAPAIIAPETPAVTTPAAKQTKNR